MSDENGNKKPATQTRLALRRLRRHRLAMSSLWILGILYVLCIFADFIAPYNFDDERRDLSYCPVMRINFVDIMSNIR